jgi:hypothetical protein
LLAVALGLAGCVSPDAREPRSFFFSPRGDDRRGDGTVEKPWATLAKASELRLRPGDRVLLEAGGRFAGTLTLDDEDGGAEGRPVVVASYGQGRAVIDAGERPGVVVRNCGYVAVQDLMVSGAGARRNRASGVAFINGKAFRKGRRNESLRDVGVKNVEASGFGLEGIHIDAPGGVGFEGVRIEDCVTRDNGHCGIYVSGKREATGQYGHRDLVIARCRASNNLGNGADDDENRSGSGIFLTGVDKAVVERSVAYENGQRCRAKKGGPMGIWVSESNDVVIQHCESFANRTGGKYDGGGFGIDGGATNCVLQYNYSHDNEGSGFGLFQYAWAHPWGNNTVRYNVSENDGRRNGYAGIHIWNGGSGIRAAWVYHNTVVMRGAGETGYAGRPTRAIWVQSGTEGLRVINNVLVAPANVTLVDVSWGQRDPVFAGNCYWAMGAEVMFDWQGGRYRGMEQFRLSSAQERGTGWIADPKFAGVGKGWEKFMPTEGSVLVDRAVELKDGGRRDISGNAVPVGRGADVGAVERRSTNEGSRTAQSSVQ